MKKEMSSLDVRSVVSEMADLENAHMDKIFHWGAGNVLFRITVPGGKKELFFRDKKWLYISPTKPDTPVMPTSFASFLRKRLDNARIGKVYQAGFDRVVIMELKKADIDYQIVFEIFGGGNVLLVSEGKIVNCLIHKTYRDRATRPGEDYIMPKPRFDPGTSSYEDFVSLFRSSESDTVRTLATSVNLGGQYAEEVCVRGGMDKNAPAESVSEDGLKTMFEKIGELVSAAETSPEPTLYKTDGKIVDLAPVKLMSCEGAETETFDSLSMAIDAMVKEDETDAIEEYVDPSIVKLRRRIERQRETVEEYSGDSEEFRLQADALYTEYSKVETLLKVLKEQSEKLTWDKLKEGAMKIPYVKSIDPSKNAVTAEVGGYNTVLDYTKGIDTNASLIYQKGKDIGERGKRAEEALETSLRELEKLEKGFEKKKQLELTRAQPTKQFWFERYKWFVTESGKLVIGGKNAHTNDNVVKKHMKEADVYVHADVHGAPSVIIKDGNVATPEELRQVCIFAYCHSKAWVSAMSNGSAYWVYPDQVSKTPNPGEFVPRGAFIIRGKRNYEYHIESEMGVGETEYQDERKIMCGPVELIEKICEKYFIIRPGRGKNKRTPNEIAKAFDVPEEEISRIIPPGDSDIVKTVWPKDDEEISEE